MPSPVNSAHLLAGALSGTVFGIITDRFISKDSNGLRGAAYGSAIGGLGALASDLYMGTGYRRHRTVKTNNPEVSKDAYIVISGGGGGDWQEGKNLDTKAMDEMLGKGRYKMFGFDELDLAVPYINSLPKDTRIHIVGHSLGGSSAYRLAQVAGLLDRKVDNLITMDPVGKNTGLKRPEGKPFNVDRWVNYYPRAVHPFGHVTDGIAMIGGSWRKVQGADNRNIDKRNHTDIRYAARDEIRKMLNEQ